MKGISTDEMQFFDLNDYPHQPRQNNIFKEWYVVGICEQKNIQRGKNGFWFIFAIKSIEKSFY